MLKLRKKTEVLTTYELGKYILETKKVPTPIYSSPRRYMNKILMGSGVHSVLANVRKNEKVQIDGHLVRVKSLKRR